MTSDLQPLVWKSFCSVFLVFLVFSVPRARKHLKTNVFCSFSNYDLGSSAHSLEIMFFWFLSDFPVFLLGLEIIGFTHVFYLCPCNNIGSANVLKLITCGRLGITI